MDTCRKYLAMEAGFRYNQVHRLNHKIILGECMQEQGSPFTGRAASILLAAGPQDEQAQSLVQTLRSAGLRVIFAETVNIAARASEATACVVVLRPDTWKTQTIATVMRAKPDCLIPVLAETMELPRGPWTQAAISLVDAPEQAEQELIQALRDYLAARPLPETGGQGSSGQFTLSDINRLTRRRRRSARPLITTILVLLIFGLGGLLGYRYYTGQPGKSAAATNQPGKSTTTPVNLPTSAPHVTYSATTPGPDCDRGIGQWDKGEHYIKTVDNKKVEVFDKYTTLQCQSDGMLVTRSGDYDVYSELFFEGPGVEGSIARHYFAQVDATITAGDAQASLAMDAHIQGNNYGRYNFDINTLGHWEASIGSTVDGSSINRLAIGFLPKAAKTYTLAMEVNGPLMSFWIDGTRVTTVIDTTYSGDDSIAFGMSDWSAKTPISALFSHFKYEELPLGSQATPSVLATATTQTQNSLHTLYSARVPGYNCDKGAGQWQPLADSNNPGKLHCLSSGMQLTVPASSKLIAEEDYYGLDGHFPQNYRISAQIDVSAANRSCAGLSTRLSPGNSHGAYAFVICPDGSWEIALVTDKYKSLAQGWVGAQNAYTITAVSNGSAQTLYINGQLIKTVHDSHLQSTDRIGLDVGLYQSGQQASAIFSDFVFTPLP